MTVFYTDEISDGDNLTVTCKLLRKWKGSLYKLVWSNLLIYVCLYYTLSFTYRFALTENQKRWLVSHSEMKTVLVNPVSAT
ncbi:Bestrophin 2 [Fasciola gigantica]|uniref:Bestrophin homolog n=1 Tax=Fasciola gigantica TaxID=46835 RepID=A0A504YKC2_FASGI|nr:Bestrophin 2 [Fasciola gigantica]